MKQLRFSTRTLLIVVAILAMGLATYSVVTSSVAPAQAGRPLASGTLDHVTVWKKPVQRPGETGSNEGNSPPAGSRVEVYSNFILITPQNGPTTLTPHGWYTDLTFTRDKE